MHMRAVEHTIHRGLCTHHAAWVNHTENRCESADPVPGRDVHDRSSRAFENLTGCLRTIVPRAAIVLQKDHHDEIVDAEAGSRSKMRRENPL